MVERRSHVRVGRKGGSGSTRDVGSSIGGGAVAHDRVGGVYSIATVVDDLIDRVMVDPCLNANPLVDEAHHKVPPAGFKYLVTEMLCWAAGGPQKYTGKDMESSHQPAHHAGRVGRPHGRRGADARQVRGPGGRAGRGRGDRREYTELDRHGLTGARLGQIGMGGSAWNGSAPSRPSVATPSRAWRARRWPWPSSADTPIERLVALAKLRWRIERDYQELKQELGLGHFEGRGWRGFHHHASLCIAAYGFLVRERAALPPTGPASPSGLQTPPLPEGFRPRGARATPRNATFSNSIATLRHRLAVLLARQLDLCPCCGRSRRGP